MNITLVVSSLGSGGAERVLAGLANYWVQFHNVTIVTYLEKTEKQVPVNIIFKECF